MTKDFALDVDAESCSAPGYRPTLPIMRILSRAMVALLQWYQQ